MHVYSRQTRERHLSFPPDPTDIYSCASTAFSLDLLEDASLVSGRKRPSDSHVSLPARGINVPIGRAELTGVAKSDPHWKHVIERGTEGGMVRLRGTDEVAMDFTA